MMSEKENIMKIANLRVFLEKRIQDMEKELDGLKTLLEVIDKNLLKESFKRPKISKPIETRKKQTIPQKAPIITQKRGIPLKTVTGDLLAQIVTEKDFTKIILAEDKDFDINIPPFTSFFVERVLAKMQEKDKVDVNNGKIDPESIISFEIKQDKNIIREISLKNLRPERIRELKSSIRWTLEKMYDRMKQKT
ncbi:hypothetical protein KJN74_01360 [Candidatus Bathyarchaeota archaeon]|nr:hypothetical protein [Candidatus Bathyarchaeota archaeon]